MSRAAGVGFPVRLRRWLPPALAGLCLCAFGALKLFALRYTAGDDNIYLYLAQRSAEGLLPYRDFFHAHPPLHLVPQIVLLWLAGGFSLAAARALPIASSALAGVFLYRLGRRVGAAEGVLSCALFLFSFDVLRMSTHLTGANLCAMWVALGLERLARQRDGQAALAFAFASGTLQSAIPTAIAVALVLLAAAPRRALRFAGIGILASACLHVTSLVVFGSAYVDQVLLFHLEKLPTSGGTLGVFVGTIRYNAWLFAGALCGLAALSLELRERRPPLPLLLALGGALGSIAFLAALARLFNYYFAVLFVCLAPLAAFGLAETARRIRAARRTRHPRALREALVLTALVALGLLPLGASRLGNPGATIRHTWRDSGCRGVDAVVHRLFWRDEEVEGRQYGGVTQYLWHEAQGFEAADRFAGYVRQHTAPGETIFGDSASTPLIALLAGRRISFDVADTNAMRFTTGQIDMGELIGRLDESPPRVVVTQEGRGIFTSREFQRWVGRHYAPALRYDAGTGRSYVLWRSVR